jgi:hypothetical protein
MRAGRAPGLSGWARGRAQGWSAVTAQQPGADGQPRPQFLPGARVAAAGFDARSAAAFPSLAPRGAPAGPAPTSPMPAPPAAPHPAVAGQAAHSRAGGGHAPQEPPPPGRACAVQAGCHVGAERAAARWAGPRGRSASPGASWRAALEPAAPGPGPAGGPGPRSGPQTPPAGEAQLGLRRNSSSAPDLGALAGGGAQAADELAAAHPWAPQDMLEVRLSPSAPSSA